MLRLGAEELLESTLTAHYNWLKKSSQFENELTVTVDITNQLDACDEAPFIVGRFGPLEQTVKAIFSHSNTFRGQTIAVFTFEVQD